MKSPILILAILVISILLLPEANGQVVETKKNETTEKVNKRVDEKVNKAVENIGKGLGGLLNRKDKTKETKTEEKTEQAQKEGEPDVEKDQNPDMAKDQPAQQKLVWAKYDFVPGDDIIFEDNLEGEENGEFPSRWDLVAGTVENAVFGGENVIMFRGGRPSIIPYLKNSNIDYLPDPFTIEFDLYLPSSSFTIYFSDRKNQGVPANSDYLNIWENNMVFGAARSQLPENGSIKNRWAHISIAYTSGKFKAYIDETRLINIPRLAFDPTGITFNSYNASDDNLLYIKNIRIAKGGVKYYDRFLQDGKIVSNGIRFDTGKSSLRPESMGVINEIFQMLSEHTEIIISVEGHTDSDGDGNLNQKLSEERAAVVMNRLVEMGIEKERLTSKGFGESSPVKPNDSSENKAGNRRVEFVKR